MTPIENWKMSRQEIDKALELQQMRKEAGITRPQMAKLLELRPEGYLEYERGHERIPPQTMDRIKQILDGVKSGKIKPPIVWGEEIDE